MPQIVWSAQPNGRHDYANRRWHELTGLSVEQAEGDGWQPATPTNLVEDPAREGKILPGHRMHQR